MTSGQQPARVLFYAGSWDIGGARTQVTLALKYLNRERFQPHLIVPDAESIARDEFPADVVIHSYRAGDPRSNSRWQRIRRLAQVLREQRIDLVCERTYLATLDMACAARLRPTKRVAMAVADPAIQFQKYARWPRWLWWQVSRWAFNSAHLVLTNSEGLRQQMLAFWQLKNSQVQLQANALDPSWFQVPHSKPTAPRKRLLSVGRIDTDKGLEDLLEALVGVRERRGKLPFHWTIVGDGPAALPLRERIRQWNLTDDVTFSGPVDRPQAAYVAADLFCLPSHSEGSPNVLLEALACGVPVLATDCASGPREILQDGIYGKLVPVGNISALTTALEEFLDQPAQWQAKACAGRAMVRKTFEASHVIQRLESHFDRVLQQKSAG